MKAACNAILDFREYLVVLNSVTCYRHNSKVSTLMSTFNSHKSRIREWEQVISPPPLCSFQVLTLLREFSSTPIRNNFRNFFTLCSVHYSTKWLYFVFVIPQEKFPMEKKKKRKKIICINASRFPLLFSNLSPDSKIAGRCPFKQVSRCVNELYSFSN